MSTLLLLPAPTAPRTTPELLTAGFMAIGVRAAIDRNPAWNPDTFSGEVGLVEYVLDPWALALDQAGDALERIGLESNGVFAYEAAEQFGHDYAEALIRSTGRTGASIARKLLAHLYDVDESVLDAIPFPAT